MFLNESLVAAKCFSNAIVINVNHNVRFPIFINLYRACTVMQISSLHSPLFFLFSPLLLKGSNEMHSCDFFQLLTNIHQIQNMLNQHQSLKNPKTQRSGAAGITLVLSHLINSVISVDINTTFGGKHNH